MREALLLIRPAPMPGDRLSSVLSAALDGRATEEICTAQALAVWGGAGGLRNRRILFAIALGERGMNLEWCAMLAFLRGCPGCLEGSVGAVLIDGTGELYTKSAAKELVFAANLAGCAFVGQPLVEGTGSLANFTVQAKNAGTGLFEAYQGAAHHLADRLEAFEFPRRESPRLLALHASSHSTSNTMALWERVRGLLGGISVTEVGLRNGTLSDCSGCPYTACLHFGERGGCFYGGVMVEEVYPALRQADAVLFLAPNYNDALSANLTACINRLTALFRAVRFYDKAVFGIVVSGYSGGDIVAGQIISAMCINKTFFLPARFALIETANDAGTALRLPGIEERISAFAAGIRAALLKSQPKETP